MLLQKAQIGKTAVLIIILTLLATLAAMPLFLQADSTGGTTQEANLFLPVVYNEDDLTPNPGTDATPTPTTTASPAPQCNLQIISGAIANSGSVAVIGDVGIEVTITNLTTNQVIGNGVLNGPFVGYDCPGIGVISVSPRLDETNTDHMLLAQQTDNSNNSVTTTVQSVTDPVPSSTPDIPYLAVAPNCGSGPSIEFKVQGSNWPIDQSLTLSWEGVP